jgi:hypothetical protein
MSCLNHWEMKCHVNGDTIKAKLITIPYDITGFDFLMQFRKKVIGVNENPVAFEWSTTDDSFEITDAVNGKILMNKKNIRITELGEYVADFQMIRANNDVETKFSASMVIIQDISRP